MAQKRRYDMYSAHKRATRGSAYAPHESERRSPRGQKVKKNALSEMVKSAKSKQKPFDHLLLITIITLVVFGLVMVFSASSPSAIVYNNNPFYYVIRQGIAAIIGIGLMFLLSRIDYHIYGLCAFPILAISFLLLLTVYIPGVGVVANNARRWIKLGISSFQLQPSEIAKIALIIYFSYSVSLLKKRIQKGVEFFRYVVILGAFSGLLIIEPHLSATLVICMVGMLILFLAGGRVRHFVVVGIAAVAMGAFLVVYKYSYQLERITTLFDPFADKLGAGYQVVNSLYAIASGGLFGLGIGKSRQKFLYLPEPHNDFIFAIICEELGLAGAVLLLVLFGVLIWKGYRIAQEAPDMYGMLLASGITSLVAIQVIVNIAVVTSVAPATGIALPFFSYGGSSLIILLSAMGILLNISRQRVGTVKNPEGTVPKKPSK